MRCDLHLGDCRAVLAEIEAESVDAIVCDPPYELAFMGKGWDSAGVSFDPETWRACLRVLKPGGHLLAFGGTRTVHRIAVAIEDAGFEIRDQIVWMYGSGFPKSLNVGDGRGTALKPAHEPVVVARKPLCGTVAANVTEYGTGALNIDGCRIGFVSDADERESKDKNRHRDFSTGPRNNMVYGVDDRNRGNYDAPGRWPANVCLDEDAAALLDEQSGERKSGGCMHDRSNIHRSVYGVPSGNGITKRQADTGGASRFFYVAKASRAERNAGLDGMPERVSGMSNGAQLHGDGYDKAQSIGLNKVIPRQNHHPTVKPIALMRWLVRLVTPPDGIVCDPFLGSGTTGCAAALEGFGFIGIEQDAEYLEIARRRIAHARGPLFAEGAA